MSAKNNAFADFDKVNSEIRVLNKRLKELLVKRNALRSECVGVLNDYPQNAKLSPREMQVLDLAAHTDMQAKEIGNRLNISIRTVKFHLGSIYRKFGISGRGQLYISMSKPL